MKKIFLNYKLLLFVLMAAALFFGGGDRAKATAAPDGVECHWVDSAHIVCTWNGNATSTGREDITDCSGQKSWTCIDFYFNSPRSKDAKMVVFDVENECMNLYFTTNQPNAAFYSENGNNDNCREDSPPPDNTATNIRVDKVLNSGIQPGNTCSIRRPGATSNGPCDGAGNTPDSGNWTGLNTAVFLERAEALAAQEEAFNTCNDEAPLGFILCPALDGVNKAIGKLIGGTGQSTGREGLLITFLKVPSIDINETPKPKIVIVVNNVVNIANIIYILIFLILIFSSSLPLGLDNYTIKKTLPKFIAAVILTQFSLVICSVVVDFFNLLGLAIPNLIFALTSGPPGNDVYYQTANGVGGTMGKLMTDSAASLLGYVLLFIFVILALIAALTAMIYLVIRYFVIYIMIILAPLAYVAWVLPGTEKFFSQWWKNFIRVNAMFLMIMGMLSISIVLAQVFEDTDDGKGVYSLIGALMPIIALLMVPKTLKWTTSAMNSLVSGAAGFATGKLSAGGKYAQGKATQGAKAAKEAGQNTIAESKFGNTRFGGMAAGAGMGSLFKTSGAQNRLNAKQAKLRSERSGGVAVQYAKMRANKPAKTGIAATDAANSKAHAEKIVNEVGGNKSSQFALMSQAAQARDLDTIDALRTSMSEQDWNEGVNSNYQAFDGMPIDREYKANKRLEAIGKLGKSELVDMSAPAQEQIHTAGLGGAIPLKSFADASDDRNTRTKISQDLLIDAHARALADSTSNAARKLLNELNPDGSWR